MPNDSSHTTGQRRIDRLIEWRDENAVGGPRVAVDHSTTHLDDYFTQLKERSWVRTPGYRGKRKRHEVLPVNTYSYMEYKIFSSSLPCSYGPVSYGPGQTFSEEVLFLNTGVGVYTPGFFFHPDDINTQLINRAAGQRFNLPVFLVEARKTADLVTHRARYLAEAAHSLLRGDFRGFYNMLRPTPGGFVPHTRRVFELERKQFDSNFGRWPAKTAADIWKEYAYGWRPFIKDVQDAVNTLLDLGTSSPSAMISKVTAKHEKRTIEESGEEIILSDPTTNLYVKGKYERRSFQSVRGTLFFRLNVESEFNKFHFTDIPSVIWEVIPYSFVADWFLPIGNFLSALSAQSGVDFVSGSVGRKYQTQQTTFATYTPGWHVPAGPIGMGMYTQLERLPILSMILPEISMRDLKLDLSARQLISAAALLHDPLAKMLSAVKAA